MAKIAAGFERRDIGKEKLKRAKPSDNNITVQSSIVDESSFFDPPALMNSVSVQVKLPQGGLNNNRAAAMVLQRAPTIIIERPGVINQRMKRSTTFYQAFRTSMLSLQKVVSKSSEAYT